MKIAAIIPARYASTRFPGKPLALLAGRPMIQHVYERVVACGRFAQVIVATDDERIAQTVKGFGGDVAMTATTHLSGTDRIAEVSARLKDIDVVVNVQGDEPFIAISQLEQLCDFFQDEAVAIATLAHPLNKLEEIENLNIVKAVFADDGRALYFSRAPVPFLRDIPKSDWAAAGQHFQHLGIYGYRHSVLAELTALPTVALEQNESLEQLRWLAAGYSMFVGITHHKSIGIDTREDLAKAEQMITND